MTKRRNKVCRRIAVALTVALLIGQGNVSVLAEEETMSAKTENSDGEVTGTEGGSAENIDFGVGEDGAGSGIDGSTDEMDADWTREDERNRGDATDNEDKENGDTDNNEIGDDTENSDESNDDGGHESAEEKLEPPADSIGEKMVLENEKPEEEDISMSAEDGAEVYAVGDTFVVDHITYEIIQEAMREVEVKGFADDTAQNKNVIIPEKVLDVNNMEWSVTRIGNEAFKGSTILSSIILPDTVIDIGEDAFFNCKKLMSVNYSDNVTRIGYRAFANCTWLVYINIPSQLSDLGPYAFAECKYAECDPVMNLPGTLNEIPEGAFQGCNGLKKVVIPNTVKAIGGYSFNSCTNLESVTITPGCTAGIGQAAFAYCGSLSEINLPNTISEIESGVFLGDTAMETMNISMNQVGSIPVLNVTAFRYCPVPRYIVFKNADGTIELTGDDLEKAEQEYLNVDDGNADDEYWYGWSIKKPTNIQSTYTVTINVKKDGKEWNNHGRSFALLGDGVSSFITSAYQAMDNKYQIDKVPNGTYRIYDVTGVQADSLYSQARDTGMDVRVSGMDTEVDVTVDGKDTEEEINYYTVIFYDGEDAYKAGSPQEPQTVLDKKKAKEPVAPGKTGYRFAGWKTEDGGSTPYDFDSAITKSTDIFASWAVKTDGDDGDNPNPGGDDEDTTNPGGDEDTPNSGGGEGTGDSSNPGGGSGNSDGGNGSEKHSNSVSGSGPGNNADLDSGSSTENIQVTVLSEMASIPTENGTAADGTSAGTSGQSTNGTEPKTGDTTHMEVYATVAMIAGLTYLLLYFMEEGRGMTEQEKNVFVAALIRWGKKGGAFRKGCAVAAIFCLLAYYHAIGKRAGKNDLNDKYLGMAS